MKTITPSPGDVRAKLDKLLYELDCIWLAGVFDKEAQCKVLRDITAELTRLKNETNYRVRREVSLNGYRAQTCKTKMSKPG